MTRASDAIYRALAGAFSLQDQPASPRPVTQPASTTSSPPVKLKSDKPESSAAPTRPPAPGELGAAQLDSQRLLELLQSSLYALRDSLSRSRPTRLAPAHELAAADEHEGAPAKLVLDGSARASSDELHLLCKLLHAQLDPSTAAPTPAPTNLSSSSARPSSPTSGPWPRLLISSSRELNETHAPYLLESVLVRSPSKGAGGPNEPLERSARYLLESLFNKAANGARLPVSAGDAAPDYAAPSGAAEAADSSTSDRRVTLTVKHWPRATYVDERRHLHLAYWLIELPTSTGSNNASQQWLIGPREATQLLGQLERATLEAELESNRLSQVGERLVEPLLQAGEPSWSWSAKLQPPRVIDDELFNRQQQQQQVARNTTSGLQLLAHRLANSSFVENLHLYLIILFLMLFCVILCFACPMMCCQRRPAFPVPSATKSSASGHRAELGFSSRQRQQDEQNTDDLAKPEQASVWRKLSNTTTTLTRDHSQLDRYEGTWRTLDAERRLERVAARDQSQQTLVYTLTKSDLVHKGARKQPLGQASKAVQASSPGLISLDGANEFDRWPLTDCRQQRSSDTMSKSELLMVKEKLVPILRHSAAESERHHLEERQTSGPDYVNQPARQVSSLEPGSLGYMDEPSGAESRSLAQAPKQRHPSPASKLQLPERARDQIRAIKLELGQLEGRDAAMSSTYKRYDVT